MLIVFSTGTPGLTPGYAILNADKSAYQARVTAGITDLGGGEYAATVADATLGSRTVLWDTGETVPRYASETFATDFTAIKDKTDTIPADWVNIPAGVGAITWTYTLTTEDGTPIPDAEVWVTTDSDGSNIVASGRTDAFGVVTFYLDAGTYFIWAQKLGTNFDNPDIEVVP